MGSRLYFPVNIASAVSPAYDASWNTTTGAIRRLLEHKPLADSGNRTSISEAVTGATAVLGVQYVSDAIPANITISGTVLMSAMGRSTLTTLGKLKMVVRVVNGAGTTIRGTLYEGEAVNAFPNTEVYATRVVGGALTSVNALTGDRVVVEVGGSFVASEVKAGIIFGRGDEFLAPDSSGIDDGDVNTNGVIRRSWVEFSQNNIWGAPAPVMAGEYVEAIVAPSRTPTNLAGEYVEAIVAPPRTPTNLAGEFVEAIISPPRTPLNVAGVFVEVMIPRQSQFIRVPHRVGNPLMQLKRKMPDGSWHSIHTTDHSVHLP